MTLTEGDFGAFFRAIHGVDPFPWQGELARQVVAEGKWPSTLDLPTGAGKTAVIDVAVFALAVDAGRPPAARSAPRRTVFVVDRRVVVDQTRLRAMKIASALGEAREGVLGLARDLLCSLSNSGRPLGVAVLRGGMPRNEGWARSPDQPLVAVSTVDQVGSRLLFRGYGLSDRMRPIHAGLLGEDTLFVLDEVHLAEPFAETLSAIATRYRRRDDALLPSRWGVVRMSATPPGTDGGPGPIFGLTPKDHAHPVLSRRLTASKPTRLLKRVDVGGGDEASRRARFAVASAASARELLDSGLKTVLVVVNRVDTARAAWNELRGAGRPAVLLTGRMRPLDRDRVVSGLLPRIGAGHSRGADEDPIIVVATQCVEAGADLDFDGLVSECASLDALRQRFGRLNRLGDYPVCAGRILVRSDQAKDSDHDPVYGSSLAATWNWLEARGPELDLGIGRLDLPGAEELERLRPPRRSAPVLMPGHLDLWAQTSPCPVPDPVVSHWLHGPSAGVPELQLVWRADLTEACLRETLDAPLHPSSPNANRALATALETVSVAPPGSLEAISVPVFAVRAWLMREPAGPETADIEGEEPPQEERERKTTEGGRPALLWKGDESRVLTPDYLRAGMTLVVPAEYGGIRSDNWDPAAVEPVRDLGDLVQLQQRARPTLRLHSAVLGPWLEGREELDACAPVADAEQPHGDVEDLVSTALSMLTMCQPGGAASWVAQAADLLASERRRRTTVPEGSAHFVVVSRRVLRDLGGAPGWSLPGPDDSDADPGVTEDDTSVFTSVQVTLADHSSHVEEQARGFASRCGLRGEMIRDLAWAGYLHDVGKADRRFQQMLCGGSEVALELLEQPLAKSAIPATNARARATTRARSGYLPGLRHELMSLALIQEVDAIRARVNDWDLVLHLVASHHGWCRPFAPALDDPGGGTVTHQLRHAEDLVLDLEAKADHHLARVDSPVADRFWRLVRRYGWFGLAWLEAILRLADHRASAAEQEGKP